MLITKHGIWNIRARLFWYSILEEMEHDAELKTSTEILMGQILLSVTPNQPFAMYNR